jgi:hypothetical protein
MQEPPGTIDEDILDRIQGSIIGMALGDALGAHVEFRPRKFLVAKPVEDLKGGGTWGLEKGQVKLFLLFFMLNKVEISSKKAFQSTFYFVFIGCQKTLLLKNSSKEYMF